VCVFDRYIIGLLKAECGLAINILKFANDVACN